MNGALPIVTVILSSLVGVSSFIFGRRKTKAEAIAAEAMADKTSAEADTIKGQGWMAVNAELRTQLELQSERIDKLTERLDKQSAENFRLKRRVRHLELLYDHPAEEVG